MIHLSEERISEIADLNNAKVDENTHFSNCLDCQNILAQYKQISNLLQDELQVDTIDLTKQVIDRIRRNQQTVNYSNGIYYLIAAGLLVLASITLYFFPVNINLTAFRELIPNIPFIKNNLNTISSILVSVVLMLSLERIYLRFKH